MHPLRISLVTYNIWGDERWDFRKAALREFMQLFDPDVACLQEFCSTSRALLDTTLSTHRCVDDAFPGWTEQSNIYWRDSLFAEIDHGAEEVGIEHEPYRRLFWVRLHVKALDCPMLVATAHLTHQRHPQEAATGQSPRIAQTRRIIEELTRLAPASDPVFFMGDLNDPVHPTHLLQDAGYSTCFASLGIQPSPTFKCYPTADVKPGAVPTNQCIDWLVANDRARALSASVPHFYYDDAAPSDHWPVHAVYELRK